MVKFDKGIRVEPVFRDEHIKVLYDEYFLQSTSILVVTACFARQTRTSFNMYKLIILSAVLALAVAAPRPSLVAYSAPVVVSPAVTSYSAYSSGVVHAAPLSVVPVVQQHVVHQPVVPLTYAAHLPTVLV
ncbi:hypothetical protein evm_010699 [Chilo suppressalis]|nr:hypothetical protein evm_010699 [Chilo suppressalis]